MMDRHVPLVVLVALVVAGLLALATPNAFALQDDETVWEHPRPGAVGSPEASLASKHLYDLANLLNDNQEAGIEADATRLARFGLPTAILVQLLELSADDAAAYAGEVRRQWGIETEPGADDGLVILVTLDRESDKLLTTMSWGKNALPHHGIDSAVASTIQADWLDTYVREGYLYEGILYSLRRLIYHSIYAPEPQAPLTTAQRIGNVVTDILGPLVALGAAVLVSRWWRSSWAKHGVGGPVLLWGIPAASLLVALSAIWAQSGWGATSAFVLLALAAAIWVRRDPARTKRAGMSVGKVAP